MTSFDSWEVAVRPPEDYLMHFRTKGSKNGVRRYQTESGEWTDLGLQERRKREGFGEERKAQRRAERAERHQARKAARKEKRQAFVEQMRKRNAKNLSDEELKSRIARLKLEKEYKDLNKSQVLETGAKLIKSYLDAKEKRLDRQMKRNELVVRDREAKSKLLNAKAANKNATNDLIDNIFSGKGKKKAKKELIEAKAKNQVRGAIRKSISGVVTKEGRRIVDEMGEHSTVMKVGRGVKKAGKAVGRGAAKAGRAIINRMKR